MYKPDPTYGVILVPAGAPEPLQTAPAGRATVHGGPVASPGAPGLAPVIPLPSCRLVRGGVDKDGRPVDGWASFLAGVPEMQRQPGDEALWQELVPSEQIAASIPRAVAAHEHTQAHEDPALDAFGGPNTPNSRFVPELRK